VRALASAAVALLVPMLRLVRTALPPFVSMLRWLRPVLPELVGLFIGWRIARALLNGASRGRDDRALAKLARSSAR
jgi:hypothetical protein